MKKLSKLIALVLSFCVALSLAAGCGGAESVGEIKGNYQDIDKLSEQDLTKANAALMAATCSDAELIEIPGPNASLGASLKANADVKVAIDSVDKNNNAVKNDISVNGNLEVGLSASSNEESKLSALAAMLKLNGKVSLPNAIFSKEETGNREISAKEELYVDASEGLEDAYIYMNTELKGLPEPAEGETSPAEMINGKKKISVSTLGLILMGGLQLPELPKLPSMPKLPLPETGLTIELVTSVLNQFDVKLSVDCSDGVKFKLSTTDTTKDKIKSALTIAGIKVSGLKIDKLNASFYMQLNAEGHLVATAASAEVKIEIPAELTDGDKISIEGKVSISLNIGEVEVKLPDNLATDESYEEIVLPPTDGPADAGAGE